MKTSKLYAKLASLVQARLNCIEKGNAEWEEKHEENAFNLCARYMPSGSGVDCGTLIDWDKSTAQRLVFKTSFHHMDESGGYDGWTEHSVIVTPCLYSGFSMRITGKNRNDIKEYLAQLFHGALSAEVDNDGVLMPDGLILEHKGYYFFAEEIDGKTWYGVSSKPIKPHCAYTYLSQLLTYKGL